jgi:hypothetical protein
MFMHSKIAQQDNSFFQWLACKPGVLAWASCLVTRADFSLFQFVHLWCILISGELKHSSRVKVSCPSSHTQQTFLMIFGNSINPESLAKPARPALGNQRLKEPAEEPDEQALQKNEPSQVEI